ncbi:MAG: methyltransferase domain-containing protein [Candidatus Heimdallarchaeota archaeon]|nr:methyltransferase domain-containing protein [Candidatus Heimdallarchaeota archaeon]
MNDTETHSEYVIQTSKRKGQKVIEKLKEKNLYDNSRKIMIEKDKLLIPVKGKIKGTKRKNLPARFQLSNLRKKFGLQSFDIIGEIIVLFIPHNKLELKNEIGNFLMALYPHVKAVYREVAEASGDFRIQIKELIAGEGSETIHIENKLKLKLDVTKVFFSPRQVTEREELMKHIRKGDRICVFFSGIGPIPIYLAKFSKAKKIVGIELNENAHQYALENLELNNTKNVELINGDVRAVIPELTQKELFDIVIMPSPKNSGSFLDTAKLAIKPKGKLICYEATSEKLLENKITELEKTGFIVEHIKKSMEIAPREWRFIITSIKS